MGVLSPLDQTGGGLVQAPQETKARAVAGPWSPPAYAQRKRAVW